MTDLLPPLIPRRIRRWAMALLWAAVEDPWGEEQ
jgi:hypothetical protein